MSEELKTDAIKECINWADTTINLSDKARAQLNNLLERIKELEAKLNGRK